MLSGPAVRRNSTCRSRQQRSRRRIARSTRRNNWRRHSDMFRALPKGKVSAVSEKSIIRQQPGRVRRLKTSRRNPAVSMESALVTNLLRRG
jgi:hypothetical protein